jgi:hypothetical protein
MLIGREQACSSRLHQQGLKDFGKESVRIQTLIEWENADGQACSFDG